jgi:hypothetical protein
MGWRGENSFQTVVNFSGSVRRTAPLYVQYTSNKSLSPRDICLKTIQLCYETISADKYETIFADKELSGKLSQFFYRQRLTQNVISSS